MGCSFLRAILWLPPRFEFGADVIDVLPEVVEGVGERRGHFHAAHDGLDFAEAMADVIQFLPGELLRGQFAFQKQ